MRVLFLLLVSSLSLSAQAYDSPNNFEFACPLRAVKATLQTISPEGHLTFYSKGELMVAKTHEETLFRIPGYSQDELKEGAVVKLRPNAKVKMRVCDRDGLVYEMKVVEMPKSTPGDDPLRRKIEGKD